MNKKNIIINFKQKKITYLGKFNQIYPAQQLYSSLMNIFDEPRNMKYDIPMEAKSKSIFKLINGWTINKKNLKHFKGKIT
jgi:hypothetical protein